MIKRKDPPVRFPLLQKQLPQRAPWDEFPPVIRNGDLKDLSSQEEYIAAKSGDVYSAMVMVKRLLKPSTVMTIKRQIGETRPKVLPVIAQEALGMNTIPLATANLIAEALGLEVERDVFQSNSPKRTNKGADHRLAFLPQFEGPIEQGRHYILIDDTLAMGGTIAALHGFVKNQGGLVCASMVMTAHEGSLELPITPGMIKAIEDKHGKEMDEFWRTEFDFGVDLLTQGEAGHLKKAKSVDEMKQRIRAAKSSKPSGMD